jgi:glycosyltransferase involved in cell wall biosynthesis
MNKVLVITYYWPPSGGAGVQRWLKFTKFLPDYGWEPIVFTPSNPEIPVSDSSLTAEVNKNLTVVTKSIWEPYSWYKKILGVPKNEKINTGFLTESKRNNLLQELSVWLRGNLFIPDARCFWIRPSIKFLTEYIRKNNIKVVISTGPPHSMHLIGLGLKRKLGINWVADFRDPWTDIDYYSELKLSKLADKRQKSMERNVVVEADKVIAVGNTIADDFKNKYDREIHVIPNGYDKNDFLKDTDVISDKMYITHVGTFVKSRNPVVLWKAIKELIHKNENFKNKIVVRLVGKVDISIRNSIKEYGLTDLVKFIDYIPHSEVPKMLKESALLLLVINNAPNMKGILTGKLFEYLAARRPVLCIGPAGGDAAEIIRNTHSGDVFMNDDVLLLKEYLEKQLELHFETGIPSCNSDISCYSRQEQTEELSKILNSISI